MVEQALEWTANMFYRRILKTLAEEGIVAFSSLHDKVTQIEVDAVKERLCQRFPEFQYADVKKTRYDFDVPEEQVRWIKDQLKQKVIELKQAGIDFRWTPGMIWLKKVSETAIQLIVFMARLCNHGKEDVWDKH